MHFRSSNLAQMEAGAEISAGGYLSGIVEKVKQFNRAVVLPLGRVCLYVILFIWVVGFAGLMLSVFAFAVWARTTTGLQFHEAAYSLTITISLILFFLFT